MTRNARVTMDDADTAELLEISRDECIELLGQLTIGRLAVNLREGSPLVVPVTYVVDGESIVFRSDGGTKLTALRERPVSFEVDAIDPIHHVGWSVLIEGVAHEMSSDDASRLELDPWAPGPKSHWIRIIPARITGRRIRAGSLPSDSRAYL